MIKTFFILNFITFLLTFLFAELSFRFNEEICFQTETIEALKRIKDLYSESDTLLKKYIYGFLLVLITVNGAIGMILAEKTYCLLQEVFRK